MSLCTNKARECEFLPPLQKTKPLTAEACQGFCVRRVEGYAYPRTAVATIFVANAAAVITVTSAVPAITVRFVAW